MRYGPMSRGVIMTHRQKCLLHPYYCTAQRHRPKSYRVGHWYHQGNSQQQLLYHGDIAHSVSNAVIFDAPTSCCGVKYRCSAMPSVNVAEHNARGRMLKLCSDCELTINTPYLPFMGELWGIFSEFFWERSQEGTAYAGHELGHHPACVETGY